MTDGAAALAALDAFLTQSEEADQAGDLEAAALDTVGYMAGRGEGKKGGMGRLGRRGLCEQEVITPLF